MGTALAEREPVALHKLENERKGYEEERKSFWEERVLPQSKKRKDIVSDALSITYNSMSVHDQLLCATNSKVDAEYCGRIFETASKNPKLSEKDKKTLDKLAKEFKRMAQEDAIFEKMYIADRLMRGGRKDEASELMKEVAPKVREMADFYMRDMDKRLKGDLASYIVDPQISKSLIAWNTIKNEVEAVKATFQNAGLPIAITESVSAATLHNCTQVLASVRYYEEELAIAYARKAGVFKEVNWEEIYQTYYKAKQA